MNYIVSPETPSILATYPDLRQGKMVESSKLIYNHNTDTLQLQTKKVFIRVCHVVPYVTTRLNIFTSAHLIFNGKSVLDLNVKQSILMAFANAGWYGFKRDWNILMVIPENIVSLNIKHPTPSPLKSIPFENMNKPSKYRLSFDEWLKEVTNNE